jgi:hypothetical protein
MNRRAQFEISAGSDGTQTTEKRPRRSSRRHGPAPSFEKGQLRGGDAPRDHSRRNTRSATRKDMPLKGYIMHPMFADLHAVPRFARSVNISAFRIGSEVPAVAEKPIPPATSPRRALSD